ncbi:3-dehydroquinate synthase [Legionella londiniensis]|uniref:3-dehydroquinate synthase n=1 Tax=Legionella londiniensis TaxID=45068 RepID=A0A0W0VQR1_9GAMM|nr:3-dehydroquinate synthase [Legionella londiniensis]KTD22421.1 3-dehydroquinate synthase [Legionella londiniensis]STX93006.1 3-dehydroquinate synthase [Legionella londiniensis]
MVKSEISHRLSIRVPGHEYPIYIGSRCLSDRAMLRQVIQADQALIVTNKTVGALYLDQVKNALSITQCNSVVLEDGESYKNQESLNQIYEILVKKHHHRDTTIVALGGGVIGDIAGLAAATYQRGVGFVQLPTTLLAQVDASIGGKTAINHPLAKNMIGCFYQPQAVIMDLETLTTLPIREFRAGFGEIIKYALLEGGALLEMVQAYLHHGLSAVSLDNLSPIIARCCMVKARFVECDERESGKRALLNLGHTFAHALEACTHFEQWLHGEAVAIGLFCAALLSHQQGVLPYSELQMIDELLRKAGLPRRIPREIDLDLLYALMFSDKKVKNKRLRFVLIKQSGNCYLEDKVTKESVHQAMLSAVEGE